MTGPVQEIIVSADEQTRFLQELAEDLNSKNVTLPSFPDVVINIRAALEDPNCSSEQLADVVRTDPVLVARLLQAANSAFHNRAGIDIVDLDLAISRLGFEVVRNTAITLAVEQIFNASQHEGSRAAIRDIWDSSLSLASMCFVLARNSKAVNADNAFLCGLFHEVGKLYILAKASSYPNLLGDAESLGTVLDQWYTSIGRSIVESWGFADEIANSLEYEENLNDDTSAPATLLDVIYSAKLLLEGEFDEERVAETEHCAPDKLSLSPETLPAIREAYDLHAQSMRRSVSA